MWYEAQFAAAKRSLNKALDHGELDEGRRSEIPLPLHEESQRLSGEEGL
jgi:hypothetical protein